MEKAKDKVPVMDKLLSDTRRSRNTSMTCSQSSARETFRLSTRDAIKCEVTVFLGR